MSLNPCEYSHKPFFAKTWIAGLHFNVLYGSICIQSLVLGSETRV